MKLKAQRRPGPRTMPRPIRSARKARRGARPGGRQARRPGVSLGRRFGGRLPSLRRIMAALAAAAVTAGLVALLSGSWLHVSEVAWAGSQFTAERDIERLLDRQRGVSVLAVDTRALRGRLERLPPIESVTVTASLPGRLEVAIVEREVAFVWETSSSRLLGAADGTLFVALPADTALEPRLAPLPRIADARAASRLMSSGDRIPEALLRTALGLAELDPAALGSDADALSVQLDDEFGFKLVASQPRWEMALGVYGMDPNQTAAAAAARLERQVTAVRTLFATRAETEIGWVDARNPGKVYFRAKG